MCSLFLVLFVCEINKSHVRLTNLSFALIIFVLFQFFEQRVAYVVL